MTFVSTLPKLILDKREYEYLERISHSRTAPQRAVERSKFLLSYYENKTISQIAREFKTNRYKVTRTIKKALSYGIYGALKDLPRKGRPRKISDGARAWIISVACMKPKDLGYSYELWTYRLLAKHIQNNCVKAGFPEVSKISQGTISKILNASNLKPHKISSYIQPQDPDFEPKSAMVLHTYKQVELLKEQSKNGKQPDIAIVSYDEKPGIQALGNKHPDLPPKPGQYSSISRDCEYVRYGTLSLLAGIDLLTGKIYHKIFEHHTSVEFIEWLKYIDSVYPKRIKIVILLDNLKVHTSKKTQKYLASVPQRFEFVFTPKHASWLNIIEAFFSKMTRSFLRGIRVSSKTELCDRTNQYFDEINEMPVIFKWKYKMDKMPGGIEI